MPDSHSIYHIYGLTSHNIERIGDNARAFQGRVDAPPSVTNSTTMRSRRNTGGDRDGEQDRQAPNQRASEALMLQQRLDQLEQQAVTFQANSSEALEAHYGDNNNHNFDAGDLYRLWHPTNTEVHLCTFLVLFKAGTSMTCLKIVHCDPEQVDYKFESEHGKLRVEHDKPGPARRPFRRQRSRQQEDEESESYLLYLRRDQEMKDHCWIDLLNPWNINWQKEYLFVYCGRLEKDSFMRVRENHLKLYDERARGPR